VSCYVILPGVYIAQKREILPLSTIIVVVVIVYLMSTISPLQVEEIF